jgi:putative FmdB family regulatory protein
MAIYDMLCRHCGHRYEISRPITQGPPKRCPKCGKKIEVSWNPSTIPAVHNHYSLMHPRHMRGMRKEF